MPTRADHGRLPLLLIYIWVFLLAGVQGSFTTLLSPYFSVEIGLSEAMLGIAVSSIAVVALVSRLPVGSSYNARRGRWMLLSGTLLCATALILTPLSSVTGVAIPGVVVLWGLGWSIATTVQLALVLAWKPRSTTRTIAVSWYAGLAGLGHIASGGSGALVDTIGYRQTFWLLAGILLLLTAIVGPFLPSGESSHHEDLTPNAHEGRRRTRKLAALFDIRGLPVAVWASFLVMFQINFITGMVKTFQPVLSLAAGLTLAQVTILHSFTGVGSTSARLTSGVLLRTSDARAAKLTTPFVLGGVLATTLIPTFQDSFLWQIPLFLIIGISRGLLRVTSTASAFSSVPDDDDRTHGRYAAVLHGGLDLGRVAGPGLAGVVAQVVGLPVMFLILPMTILACYLALSHIAKQRTQANIAS